MRVNGNVCLAYCSSKFGHISIGEASAPCMWVTFDPTVHEPIITEGRQPRQCVAVRIPEVLGLRGLSGVQQGRGP